MIQKLKATKEEIKHNRKELISYDNLRDSLEHAILTNRNDGVTRDLKTILNILDLAAIVVNNDNEEAAKDGIYYLLS
jgi:hypothetical protein